MIHFLDESKLILHVKWENFRIGLYLDFPFLLSGLNFACLDTLVFHDNWKNGNAQFCP